MITEISGINAKALHVAAGKMEVERGESIPELLVKFIYETKSPKAFVEAVRLFFSIIYNSGLTLDDLEVESPGDLISLNRSGLNED